MAQKTDLNVSPYYDDFDINDNFHRVLFRPGFAVQARELTTLQSILQNQIERHGQNIFKEGTVVIPGQVSISNAHASIQLASQFGGEDVVVAQYLNTTTPVTITGATSGVKAKVIGVEAGTSTTQPRLFIQYIEAGSDNTTQTFSDSENISADASVTHTTTYATNVASATTHTTAAQTGVSAKVENGIYYVRGQFVRVAEQTHVVNATSSTASARVGFTINETLVTPESDSSLTDNATGSSNFAAKGAHRLKIALTLTSLAESSTADSSFIEIVRVKNGQVEHNARYTDFSILGDTFARRTFDESGDYTVRPFQFDIRESVTNQVQNQTFTGVYSSGSTTDDGNTASDTLLALAVTPGKAYVKGYEIEKISNTFIDVNKARDFSTVNAGVTTFEIGNFAKITNLYNTPDIGAVSGETTAYKTLGLFDDVTSTRGSASGNQVGVARARNIKNGDNLSIDTIKRMNSFFARHEKSSKGGEGFKPSQDGFPSAGRIAWALWGGDAGQSWAAKKVKEIENVKQNMSIKIDNDKVCLDYFDEIGLTLDNDEWFEAHVDSIDDEKIDKRYHEFAYAPAGTPNVADSSSDIGMFRILYRYSQTLSVNKKTGQISSREFCQKMVAKSIAGTLYRMEDLEKASTKAVNKGFGAGGSNTYNIALYKGGANCKHKWERVFYFRRIVPKGTTFVDVDGKEYQEGEYLPNGTLNNFREVSQQFASGKMPMPDDAEMRKTTWRMKNHGFLKPRKEQERSYKTNVG